MKNYTIAKWLGVLTIHITGDFPEFILNRMAQSGIQIWSIKRISRNGFEAKIFLKDFNSVRQLRKGTGIKIRIRNRFGFPFIWKRFIQMKGLMIGLFSGLLTIFLLSNIVWGVSISGVSPEIEYKIEKSLDKLGVEQGAWKGSLKPPQELQNEILHDIPELLWVGIKIKGTTYQVQGVEKTIVEEEEEKGPRHLVAKKKGEIIDYFISKGNPVINVHQIVEKGDLLVDGYLEEEHETPPVAATGTVTAKTWYLSQVETPLQVKQEVVTGNHYKKYSLGIGGWNVPVWGFEDPEYNNTHVENYVHEFYFLHWKLPVTWNETIFLEKEAKEIKRSIKDAVMVGLEDARNQLLSELESDAEIRNEKILRRSTNNGKVKMTIEFTVYEDIAKPQPITQGD
ncbi:sporulation protein YqfD [Bacillaceae bacterium S4-13-58]